MLCVEPSEDMLSHAQKLEGLKPCLATADSFFRERSKTEQNCNKILMSASGHHIPDFQGTLCRAAEYLPAGGLLVLITRGTECTFPMWKALKSRLSYTAEEFKEPMLNAGFKVQITREVRMIRMTKGEWYDKLRKRIFSFLYDFTDKEIEEGLKELDREQFPGKEHSDTIDIKDTIVFLDATKPATL